MGKGIALALGLLLLPGPAARGEMRSRVSSPPAPRSFRPSCDIEENRGQADPAVRFLARGPGCLALLGDGGATFACGDGTRVVRMELAGAVPGDWAPGPARPGVSNYLGARAVARVRRYASALRRGAWPGVDLRWSGGADGSLEYSFEV